MPATHTRLLVGAAALIALAPTAPSQAGNGHRTGSAQRAATARAPHAISAELVPRLALSSSTIQITSRYGVGFINGRCNEPENDFCSLAARLYHTVNPHTVQQVRIGIVAGTAAGGMSGRLGFIMNIPGWRLLRARHRLTVILRGTIVHGEMLLGHVDRKVDLILTS